MDDLDTVYNHYVETGHAIFDEQPRTREAAEAWMARYDFSGLHRLIIAHGGSDAKVLGWVSSQTYRTHPPFRCSVETSIMLSPEARGCGLGSGLYTALFEILETENVHRVYAGDALRNTASVALHEKFGFRTVGEYSEYAIKHGEWISSAWFEKRLELHVPV